MAPQATGRFMAISRVMRGIALTAKGLPIPLSFLDFLEMMSADVGVNDVQEAFMFGCLVVIHRLHRFSQIPNRRRINRTNQRRRTRRNQRSFEPRMARITRM